MSDDEKPEPTEAQAAFTAATYRLLEAEKEVRELSWKLPGLTPYIVANAKTAWRSTPAQIVEGGYTRWTDLERADDATGDTKGAWHAVTRGWSDYSDEGGYEYVEVDGLPYAMPDDVEYD